MYFPAGIKALSRPQINKLLSGGSVRIENGSDHDIHLSLDQSKKLARATKKGQGMNLRFDPYQVSMNGQGLFSNTFNKAKSQAVSLAKSEAKKLLPRAKDFISREASKNKGKATQLIADTLTPYLGQQLSQDIAQQGSDKAYAEFNKQLESGANLANKKLGGGKKLPKFLYQAGDALKKIAKPVLRSAINNYTAPALTAALGPEAAIAAPAVQSALNDVAGKIGLGIGGGDLYPAGSMGGAEDLKSHHKFNFSGARLFRCYLGSFNAA